jgi:hypothetical protein
MPTFFCACGPGFNSGIIETKHPVIRTKAAERRDRSRLEIPRTEQEKLGKLRRAGDQIREMLKGCITNFPVDDLSAKEKILRRAYDVPTQ